MALKRAPAEGKVIISTPSQYALAEIERWECAGCEKNSTYTTLVDSIKHMLDEAGRRVTLVYDKRPLAENEAVRLAHPTLDSTQVHAVLPRLPLPEDRYPPHHVWGIRD
jgi:hypothetical protein